VRGDPTHIDALAVLPLANLTGSAEQEYFVEGMHDALIGELGQISILTVTSRTTVLRYRNTEKSVPEIARELHVDAVVEGSVFRAGDSVRIHVQLIRAAPQERQLWAQTYDGDLRNVLTLQKRVARAIAEQIRATLTPQERARLAAARPVDPAAYDAWAKGWFQLTRLTGGTQRTCLEYATRAVELDSTYAAAHALMAACYNLLTYLAESPPRDVFPRAKAAARKALALDETLPEAHFALASALAAYDWDWAGAEREYQRGLELNPSSAYGHSAYGWFLSWMGRHDEALAQVRRAQDLNPANPLEIQRTAAVLYVGRRYDDAVAEARRAIEIDSTLLFGYDRLGRAYAEKGMYPEATAAAERAAAVSGHAPNFQAALARMYALSGRKDEARRILEELRTLEQRRYVAPCFIAQVYAALGEKEDALRWLEKAYRVRDGDLVLLGVWPAWDPLRGDPRFRDLLRRMRFPA
jgi:TolB-like protein/Flp pilus assembly protein TadD